MDFLSSSSSEMSSSSSSDSYSPSTLSSELGLDPSDPLNMLLHNSSDDSSSSSQEGGSPPDWSTLSALWPDTSSIGSNEQQKPFTGELTDFSDMVSFPMDMDFNPSISIDPSALHFNPLLQQSPAIHLPNDFGYSPSLVQQLLQQQQKDALQPPFPFNFAPNTFYDSGSQSDTASETSSTKDSTRRLSIGSSISSPSTSSLPPFSPAQSFENAPSPPSIADSTTLAQLLASAAASQEAANSSAPSSLSPDEVAAHALAERVRQMAGVMLALPMSAQLQAFEQQQNAGIPATPSAATPSTTQAPKLPIPRLRPSGSLPIKSSAPSTTSSAASTPPPSTPHSPSPLLSAVASTQGSPSSQPAPVPSGRPKTSHTTIERRYRTNLNARIQSLRMAVPALRVLEDRDNITGSGKKKAPNKVLVTSSLPGTSGAGSGGTVVNTNGIIDIIDERGYVDGVKVARKCSKANVLGKAVEYIKVLKRRELRLRNEQAGLRALINGLVGGPALLREWEREWRNRFGGEERDEVNPDEQEGDEDEEDVDDEDGDEEESGRKRKRGKVAPAASTAVKVEKKKSVVPPAAVSQPAASDAAGFAPVATPVVPEKRKRGRPRKVVPLPASLVNQEEDNKMDVFPGGVPAQQGPGQQYLLAVFAMFSFFNSPLTSTTSSPFESSSSAGHGHAHIHTGHVIAPANQTVGVPVVAGWGLTEYIHMFHLLVSVFVLVSVVSSWTGLGKGMNIPSTVGKIVKAVKGDKKTRKSKKEWVGEAERIVLSGKEVSVFERAQVYNAITSTTASFPSISDSITAALVLYPSSASTGPLATLARVKARSKWSAISKNKGANVYEKMVLQGLTIDEAFARLSGLPSSLTASFLSASPSLGGDDEQEGLIELLAEGLVKERLHTALGVLFIRNVQEQTRETEDLASSAATIKPGQFDPAYVDPSEEETHNSRGASEDKGEKEMKKDKESLEREWGRLVDASKELGGYLGDVGRAFERVWKIKAGSAIDEDALSAVLDDDLFEDEEEGTMEKEIKSLLTALVLFHKTFASGEQEDDTSSSALLSPPPSPGRPAANSKEVREIGVLREALGSRAFEEWNSLEDARDRVVDLVVERERRWIGMGL